MKRLIALTILIGYLLLAPMCFLSGALGYTLLPNAHAISQTYDMVGMDMSLPMQATEHTSPIHALGSHLAMYIGLTGSTQTMVLDFAMLILFVCAIYVIAQVFLRVLSVNTQHHISRKTVRRILRAIAQHNELRWLSLSLISPPRVYALA